MTDSAYHNNYNIFIIRCISLSHQSPRSYFVTYYLIIFHGKIECYMSIFTLLYIFKLIHVFSRARFYAAEIASAIGYLHSLQIIYRLEKFFRHNYLVTFFLFSSLIWNFFFSSYRDLKPENILLDGRVSGVFALYACNNPQVYFQVMLHETVRNDDFWRNTALQHCCEFVSNCCNIVSALQRCATFQMVVANRSV